MGPCAAGTIAATKRASVAQTMPANTRLAVREREDRNLVGAPKVADVTAKTGPRTKARRRLFWEKDTAVHERVLTAHAC